MAETVVDARGVIMRFGGVSAVDGVSMRLHRGELRCLVGPNGAGKSTFFKCLSGQLQPTEGEILLQGRPTRGLGILELARAGVGIKTQVPNLMNGLTVRENLWLAVRARPSLSAAAVDQRVDQLLARLSLDELQHRQAADLAHGQRQVVELGVVLGPAPWLVLLDEPAGGLTATEVERMAALVRELTAEATVVVVEHDMRFVSAVADTVTVFHRGRILCEGAADVVLADARVRDVYLGRDAGARP